MNSNPGLADSTPPAPDEAETGAAAFFSNMPGFAFTLRLSPGGRLSLPFASRGIEDIFGLRSEDVRQDATPIREVVHPQDWGQITTAVTQAAQTLQPFQAEARIQRPGLPQRWIECHFTPERQAAGEVRWHGVVLDITERKAIAKALSDSEHMLQEAQRIAHVGSWDVDLVNDKLVWSDEIFRIWEIDKTRFKADFAAFLETVHPEDRERVGRVYNESIVHHSLYEVEHRLLFPDGRVKHILEQGEPQYDAQGKPVRFIGTSLDITERKRLQEVLVESERGFRSLAENIPDNIARWDTEGRYLYINPTHERTLGASLGEMVGQMLPESHQHVRAALAHVVATGQPLQTEQRLEVDGNIEVHSVSIVPEFDAEGKIVSVLGMGRDMTDIHRLQETIAARERELRALADSSPGMMGAFHFRPDGSVVMPYVSPNIRDLFGLTPQDVAEDALPLLNLVHPHDARRVKKTLWQSARAMTTWHQEYRIEHPTKGMRWMEGNTNPQPHPDGGVFWYGHVHDITERKQVLQRMELLDRAIDFSAEAVYLIDEALRFNYVNATACRMLGYSREELLAMGPCDIDTDTSREAILALIKESPLGVPLAVETRHRAKDGRIYPVEISGVQFEDGGVRFGLAVARDISERKRAETALREGKAAIQSRNDLLQAIVESSPEIIVFALDRNYCYLAFNQKHKEVMETIWGREIAVGTNMLDVIGDHPDRTSAQRGMDRALAGESFVLEDAYGDEARSRQFWRTYWAPIYSEAGQVSGLTCFVLNISEQKRMEEALAAREKEFRTLVEHTPNTIARYDRQHRRTFANEAFGALVEGGVPALLGKTPAEFPGGADAPVYEAKLSEVFATGNDVEFELNWHDGDGKEICYHLHLTAESDVAGEVVTVLAVGHDITELNAYRRKIHQLAFFDKLTSLPNRALFGDRLQQMLADASRHAQHAALVLMDLDGFKAVNDTFGHPAGDKLLCEAGKRLNSCVRATDTVARLGGDEFAILLPAIRLDHDPGVVASKILDVFRAPFLVEEKEVFVGASLGIALYPSDSEDADDLLKQADSAMYLAKRSGRNTFRFYSEDLTISAKQRLTTETDLRNCLKRGELELYYQPKHNLVDNLLAGSEALLRWNHPERGLVPPDQFISIAEDSGLIVEIGAWVLREACHTASEWNQPGKPVHKVAVNLSARQFQAGSLVKTVQDVLAQTGCRPEWIELEITESLLLEDGDKVLEELVMFRDMGLTIAIDDFGTGYSSLSYLARFPLDTLKIDRSFVSRVVEGGQHAKLVRGIIAIAQSLGQTVVAEGVETAAQAAILRDLGCQLAQGYAFGRPMPKSKFPVLGL